MKVLTIGIAAAMLSLANAASAEEPLALTDAQMDGVSAGYASAYISASSSGSGSVSVYGNLYTNDSYYYQTADAYVSANAYPYYPGNLSVSLSAGAYTSSY
jgi:hypothetical protein